MEKRTGNMDQGQVERMVFDLQSALAHPLISVANADAITRIFVGLRNPEYPAELITAALDSVQCEIERLCGKSLVDIHQELKGVE